MGLWQTELKVPQDFYWLKPWATDGAIWRETGGAGVPKSVSTIRLRDFAILSSLRYESGALNR